MEGDGESDGWADVEEGELSVSQIVGRRMKDPVLVYATGGPIGDSIVCIESDQPYIRIARETDVPLVKITNAKYTSPIEVMEYIVRYYRWRASILRIAFASSLRFNLLKSLNNEDIGHVLAGFENYAHKQIREYMDRSGLALDTPNEILWDIISEDEHADDMEFASIKFLMESSK